MKIKGFETLTLLDYPGRIAATVFTGGCNFRCPFCHNASLVDVKQTGETIDPRQVLSHLEKRKGKLTGLCITGGEPLMQSGLMEFIQSVKALGYAIKLDTNGSMPSALSPLLKGGWVDYVAMDIKNCKGKYALTAGLNGKDGGEELLGKILESIELIKSSGIPYEFRTTIVRELHTLEDVIEIGEWLAGEESYFLQTFEDSGDVLSQGMTARGKEEMQALCEALKRFVPKAALRGV